MHGYPEAAWPGSPVGALPPAADPCLPARARSLLLAQDDYNSIANSETSHAHMRMDMDTGAVAGRGGAIG